MARATGCLFWVGLGGIVLLAALFVIGSQLDDPSVPTTRADQIRAQFSPLTGVHYKLEAFIKTSMNDPKSFEHVHTTYQDQGDHLLVTTTFRGTNAYGGVVRNWTMAKVAIVDGRVLEVVDQYP